MLQFALSAIPGIIFHSIIFHFHSNPAPLLNHHSAGASVLACPVPVSIGFATPLLSSPLLPRFTLWIRRSGRHVRTGYLITPLRDRFHAAVSHRCTIIIYCARFGIWITQYRYCAHLRAYFIYRATRRQRTIAHNAQHCLGAIISLFRAVRIFGDTQALRRFAPLYFVCVLHGFFHYPQNCHSCHTITLVHTRHTLSRSHTGRKRNATPALSPSVIADIICVIALPRADVLLLRSYTFGLLLHNA